MALFQLEICAYIYKAVAVEDFTVFTFVPEENRERGNRKKKNGEKD